MTRAAPHEQTRWIQTRSQQTARGVWPESQNNDDDSGWRWGPFGIRGPRPWSLYTEQKGGSVYYPYELREGVKVSHGPGQIPPEGAVVVKGNFFQDFTHPRQLEGRDWWYWDNSLIPQLMDPSPANPQGSKLWCRLVRGSTAAREFTETASELEEHHRRVSEWIHWESQGRAQSIWDVIRVDQPPQTRNREILWVRSRSETLEHYYGQSNLELEQHLRLYCDRMGLELRVRDKRDRRTRQQFTLTDQLRASRYRAVICTHSAAALEVLCTGTPVCALGAEVAHELNTPWLEFLEDDLREPQKAEVEQQILRALTVTWHKRELLRGDWSQWPWPNRGYDQWQLF